MKKNVICTFDNNNWKYIPQFPKIPSRPQTTLSQPNPSFTTRDHSITMHNSPTSAERAIRKSLLSIAHDTHFATLVFHYLYDGLQSRFQPHARMTKRPIFLHRPIIARKCAPSPRIINYSVFTAAHRVDELGHVAAAPTTTIGAIVKQEFYEAAPERAGLALRAHNRRVYCHDHMAPHTYGYITRSHNPVRSKQIVKLSFGFTDPRNSVPAIEALFPVIERVRKGVSSVFDVSLMVLWSVPDEMYRWLSMRNWDDFIVTWCVGSFFDSWYLYCKLDQ